MRVIAGGLLLAALAGCSGGDSTTTFPVAAKESAPGLSTAASPSPSPSGLAAQALPAGPVAEASFAPFTGPASDLFGADKVMQGYLFATRYALDAAFNTTLLGLEKPRALDLSAVEASMTPDCASRYRALTAQVEAGTATEQDYTAVFVLSSWGFTGVVDGAEIASPPTRDVGFGGGETLVADVKDGGRSVEALVMRFPVKGQVLLDTPAGPKRVELAKDMELTLIESGVESRPWRVADWKASYVLGEPVADEARQ